MNDLNNNNVTHLYDKDVIIDHQCHRNSLDLRYRVEYRVDNGSRYA